MSLDRPQRSRARWLRAAAIYNAVWGTANVFWPRRTLRLLGVQESGPAFAWQTVGMMVCAYAPAYWWASRDPLPRAHVVAVGLAGKILGPLGFSWAVTTGRLPLRFGLTIVTNDLIWWPAFAAIVRDAAADAGGWRVFLSGTPPLIRESACTAKAVSTSGGAASLRWLS